MKSIATLSLLLTSLCVLPLSAQTAEAESETPKTDLEVVEQMSSKLVQAKGLSKKEFYTAFETNDAHANISRKVVQASLDVSETNKLGLLVKVDTCLAPKLVDRVRKAGFILLYEHGVVFIDTSILNVGDDWKVAGFSVYASADAGKTLEAIPLEYFNK